MTHNDAFYTREHTRGDAVARTRAAASVLRSRERHCFIVSNRARASEREERRTRAARGATLLSGPSSVHYSTLHDPVRTRHHTTPRWNRPRYTTLPYITQHPVRTDLGTLHYVTSHNTLSEPTSVHYITLHHTTPRPNRPRYTALRYITQHPVRTDLGRALRVIAAVRRRERRAAAARDGATARARRRDAGGERGECRVVGGDAQVRRDEGLGRMCGGAGSVRGGGGGAKGGAERSYETMSRAARRVSRPDETSRAAVDKGRRHTIF
jgi:hypothetical protein